MRRNQHFLGARGRVPGRVGENLGPAAPPIGGGARRLFEHTLTDGTPDNRRGASYWASEVRPVL